VGAEVAVEILRFDAGRKRIGVAVVPEGTVRARGAQPALAVGARVGGQVQRVEPFGVLVYLGPGRTGLMPVSECALDKETDLRKAFPVGSAVEALVLEIDTTLSRIRLSRKALLEAEERREVREFQQGQEQPPGEGFGSLADKLRDALRPREG
jgi:4-hydroxy-3-methylbut-2-enyl diphosphate reductase